MSIMGFEIGDKVYLRDCPTTTGVIRSLGVNICFVVLDHDPEHRYSVFFRNLGKLKRPKGDYSQLPTHERVDVIKEWRKIKVVEACPECGSLLLTFRNDSNVEARVICDEGHDTQVPFAEPYITGKHGSIKEWAELRDEELE